MKILLEILINSSVKDPTIMFSDFNGAVNTEEEKSKDGKVKKKKSPKKPKKVNIIQLVIHQPS